MNKGILQAKVAKFVAGFAQGVAFCETFLLTWREGSIMVAQSGRSGYPRR